VRFVSRSASAREDRRLASKEDMDQIAWFLTTRKAGRSVGFVSAAQFREDREKESEIAASASDDPKLQE
jgi:hypothetical protein